MCCERLERERPDHILVDMHAEATSEKVALGWHLDGRVTAVVGTHTHIPTADARVLPGGTAYITDVGMTGPRGGVIGVRKEQAIESLRTHMNIRFETSDDDPWLNGVLIRCSAPLRADSIEQVLEPWRATAAMSSALRSRDHGDDRRVLLHEVEVAGRELDLGQRGCGRRRAIAGTPPDGNRQRKQPQHVLRRQHLAEGDERESRAEGREQRVAPGAAAKNAIDGDLQHREERSDDSRRRRRPGRWT